MSASYARAKDLFIAALDHPPAERIAFIDAACAGDAELHGEVQSLLEAHEASAPRASEPAAQPFAAGELFANRYRMVARLGQGGMGDVWRADDLVLGIPVALKLMHSTAAAGQALLLNEVRLARRITHPAVCRVFDVGAEGGRLFLSMELVAG